MAIDLSVNPFLEWEDLCAHPSLSEPKLPDTASVPNKKRVTHTDKMCAILVQAASTGQTVCCKKTTNVYKAWVKEYTLQVKKAPSPQSLDHLIRQVFNAMHPSSTSRIKTAKGHMKYLIKEADKRLKRGNAYIKEFGLPYEFERLGQERKKARLSYDTSTAT